MKTDVSGFRELYSDEFIMKVAEVILDDKYKRGAEVTSPKAMSDYFINALGYKDREVFMVILFDAKNRVIDKKVLFKGSLTNTTASPREIMRYSLAHNAGACAVAHKHPSGAAIFSEADKQITNKIKQALELIEMRLLDHILVAGNDTISMAEYGYL